MVVTTGCASVCPGTLRKRRVSLASSVRKPMGFMRAPGSVSRRNTCSSDGCSVRTSSDAGVSARDRGEQLAQAPPSSGQLTVVARCVERGAERAQRVGQRGGERRRRRRKRTCFLPCCCKSASGVSRAISAP